MNVRLYRCEMGQHTVCKRVYGCSENANGMEYHPEPVLYVPVWNALPTFLDPTIVTAAVLQHQTIKVYTAVHKSV
jgi:hypothetical protein